MAAQSEPGPEGVSNTPDVAPTRGRPPASASHKKGAGKQALVQERLAGYYGMVGLIVGRVSIEDSIAIIERADKLAAAHIEVGKVNPRYMRVLESITLYGPYVELAMVHVDAGMAIMKNHGRSPLDLLNPLAPTGPRMDSPSAASPVSSTSAAAPLPYVPAGATAPTEPMPPPLTPQTDSELLVFPDEGLPGDVDIQLRQMARATGRPYDELRQEAVVALAQMRMAANGNSHTVQPGALGAPVAKE